MTNKEAIEYLKEVGYQQSAFSNFEPFYEEDSDYKNAVDTLESNLCAQEKKVGTDYEQLCDLIFPIKDFADAESIPGDKIIYEDPESGVYIVKKGKDIAEEDVVNPTEILLTERNIAVEEMHGRCTKCKHFSTGFLKFPCTDCRYEEGDNDHWEWCGVTREDLE